MKLNAIIVLIMLVISFSGVGAQTKFFVKKFSGSQISYALVNVRTITFSPGNMIVSKTSGLSDQYLFNEVRYLSFKDFSTDIPLISGEDKKLILYPNPVAEVLTVCTSQFTVGTVQMKICNLQGRLMFLRAINAGVIRQGVNIDLAFCPPGLYICHIYDGQNSISGKFFKK